MREHQLLLYVLRGNLDAVALCEALARISQTWDDLVDGDRAVADTAVHAAFQCALIELPSNPFYRRFMDTLLPVLQVVILDWITSTQLELQDDHGKNLAFVLRDQLGVFVVLCAQLIGGHTWALKIASQVRRQIYNNESLETYKQSLGGAKL